ncbi:hypothetical protein HKCCA1065_03990 [Rhodobacterales bacterium HKCCA1065]|nr:hypothetical protein [Rhodobacterales bacterium HKCCA1065]
MRHAQQLGRNIIHMGGQRRHILHHLFQPVRCFIDPRTRIGRRVQRLARGMNNLPSAFSHGMNARAQLLKAFGLAFIKRR